MAAPITCDAHNHEHLADVMLVPTNGSDTICFCQAAFLAFATEIVEAANQAEADATAADAERRLSAASPPTRGRSRRKSAAEAEQLPEQPGSADTEPETSPAEETGATGSPDPQSGEAIAVA